MSMISAGVAVVVAPMSGSTPMTTSPHPTVIAPSPTSAHPDISRGRTNRHSLNYRCGHWRHDNRGWSNHHRSGNRDSDADTEVNPGIYGSDSNRRQGQHCNSLFHILLGRLG